MFHTKSAIIAMGGCLLVRTSVRLLALALVLAFPFDARSQAQPGAQKPTIEIIDPLTIDPLVGPAPWNAGGPAVHRRVVTHDKDGAVHLDIGYNLYKKGVKLGIPYAYKTDEVCYAPSGRIRMQNEGELFEPALHFLMWRPAGAVTRFAEMLEDTVTICAMAPARVDASSHKLAPEEVGKWSENPAIKPVLHYFNVSSGPIVTGRDKSASGGVVEREVLSKRKDGSAKESVIYTTLKAGSHLSLPGKGEQICWVERGKLAITSDGQQTDVRGNSFIYKPEGAKLDELRALEDAAIICFSGPASL
jgi:hypothetical protein